MVIYLSKKGLCELSKDGDKEKIKNHIYYYFDDIIEVDPNVTIEDLMNFIMNYEKDINMFFNGAMRGFKLKPFFAEMNLKPKTINESVEFIQFSWASDYHHDPNGVDFPR